MDKATFFTGLLLRLQPREGEEPLTFRTHYETVGKALEAAIQAARTAEGGPENLTHFDRLFADDPVRRVRLAGDLMSYGLSSRLLWVSGPDMTIARANPRAAVMRERLIEAVGFVSWFDAIGAAFREGLQAGG